MGETLTEVARDAVIEGPYRYILWRRWAPGPVLTLVMLNPSKADGETDDPTITRCCRRAARLTWRGIAYGGIDVLNLFALRATEPAALLDHPDPVGPDNDRWLTCIGTGTDGQVAAAWGGQLRDPAYRELAGRAAEVLALLPGPLWCLGTTAAGDPRHPLYVSYDTPLIPYRRAA